MPGLDFLFGREGEFRQAPSAYSPEQQQALQGLLQQGLQGLGTGAIEEQARRGFRQETVPLLSERFAKVGGIGSSGYQNALQGAGTQLETNLAGLRQGNAMNLLNLGLQPQQETYFEPGTEGIAGPLAELAARAGLAYATGGTSETGTIMDLFKSLFGGKGQSPSSYTGIEAESSSPLRQRLGQYSGNQLLNQAAQSSVGLNPPGQFQSMGQARNLMQRGGQSNINKLLGQAWTQGLPQAAQNAYMGSSLNKYYPGFEL